jgi:SpoVK/Ycf46/Vps4 family AAA+-type ATPase
LFLLAGNDISKRRQVLGYFSSSHWFYTDNVLGLEYVKEGEPRMSGKIILQQDYVELFTTGIVSKPTFSPDFPAKLVTTKMDWADIIMHQKTVQQITDIKTWLHHNATFLQDWGMEKRIKPGYRALFYGPPGTGKTLAATLLGKQFGQDVYRIDLSQVVSKYIGETEKNLEKIFNKAANKNWILFFDEADALFGKRSNVQNAHDKYANQEVSYLLQRVEDFPGLIILASNFKSNIDQAFIRRFNAIIHFPMPGTAERFEIWKAAIPPKALLANDVDLMAIAGRYELSGSSIVSVIHYASLQTIYNNSNTILKQYIIEGIKREFEKEERVFTRE